MKIRLKPIMIVLSVLLIVMIPATMAKAIFDITTQTSRREADTDKSKQTRGKLIAKTTLDIDVPALPVGTCYVNSKGTSNLYFNKLKTKYKHDLTAHTIAAKIGGVGGATISSGSTGVTVASGNQSATFSCDTDKWSYSISSDIYRIFSYKETHTVDYKIKKGKKTIKTVTLSVKIKDI